MLPESFTTIRYCPGLFPAGLPLCDSAIAPASEVLEGRLPVTMVSFPCLLSSNGLIEASDLEPAGRLRTMYVL